jgi:hypothetical protein
MLFDVQSALLHCPKIQMSGDIFGIECRSCQQMRSIKQAAKPLSSAISRAAASHSGMNPIRSRVSVI